MKHSESLIRSIKLKAYIEREYTKKSNDRLKLEKLLNFKKKKNLKYTDDCEKYRVLN